MNGPLGEAPSVAIAAKTATTGIDRTSRRVICARLTLLVTGAVAGAITWPVAHGKEHFDIGGILGVLAFLGLFYLRALHGGDDPASVALAAAKAGAASDLAVSHAWRFGLGAPPYETGTTDDSASRMRYAEVLQRLRRVLNDLGEPSGSGEDVTEGMTELRRGDYELKKGEYLDNRLKPLIKTAERDALGQRKLAARYARVLFVVELLGLVCGVLRAFNVIKVDLLGITGAAVASLGVWIAFRDHQERANRLSSRIAVLAEAREHVRLAANESTLAAIVARVEEQLALESEALLPGGAEDPRTSSRDSAAVSAVHSMSAQEYFDAIAVLDKRVRSVSGTNKKFDPDVVIGVNYGGAIVAGVLFGMNKGFDLIPLSFRGGMMRDKAEQYLDLFAWEGMQRSPPHLKILVVDASVKSGDSIAEAVTCLINVLGRRGWRRGDPDLDANDDARRYVIKTAVLVMKPDGPEPPAVPIDYHVNKVTQRFPYGPV